MFPGRMFCEDAADRAMGYRVKLAGRDGVEWQRCSCVTALKIGRVLGITAHGAGEASKHLPEKMKITDDVDEATMFLGEKFTQERRTPSSSRAQLS